MVRRLASLDRLSAVYDVRRFRPLENDVRRLLGRCFEIAGRRSDATVLPAERIRLGAASGRVEDWLGCSLGELAIEDEVFVVRLREIGGGEGDV